MPQFSFVSRFAFLLLIATLTQGSRSTAAESPSQPNLVFIFADDMGYGEIHALNPERGKIPTPNLDKLVAQGTIFSDAHTASSVCTPSRYALLTGRYCWRTKLQKGVVTGNDDPVIAADRTTVAEMLGKHGYDTAIIGKWHLNYNYEGEHKRAKTKVAKNATRKPAPAPVGTRIVDGPITRGFNHYFGFHHAREMSSLCRGDRIIEEIDVVEMLPRLTSEAVRYVNEKADGAKSGKPFFLYLPLSSPHTPIVPSKEWIGKSGLGSYGDFVMQTDASAGAVIDAIDANGLTKNTLVIFSCDNGTSKAAGIKELQAKGHYPSAHLRGSKADIWDGGHRVPFITRWPAGGVKAGGTSDQLICLSDFFATTAELVGASVAENEAEDSYSFLAALSGQTVANPRRSVIHHSFSGHFAIRNERWKLVLANGSGGWSAPNEKAAAAMGAPDVQLYDMLTDPSEATNLYDHQASVKSELMKLLEYDVKRGRSTPGPDQANEREVNLWKSR
ncbi:MAG: arylsulfatase [Rubripirellula sp.]